jgi:hypothetical protein
MGGMSAEQLFGQLAEALTRELDSSGGFSTHPSGLIDRM